MNNIFNTKISDTHPINCTCKCCVGAFGQGLLAIGSLMEETPQQKADRLAEELEKKKEKEAKEALKEALLEKKKAKEARDKIRITNTKSTTEFVSIENILKDNISQLNDCVDKRPMPPMVPPFRIITTLLIIAGIVFVFCKLWVLTFLLVLLYIPYYMYFKTPQDVKDKYYAQIKQHEVEYPQFYEELSNKKQLTNESLESIKVFFASKNLIVNVKLTGPTDLNLKTNVVKINKKFTYAFEFPNDQPEE